METPYDEVAIGVDEESASAAGGDQNVEDHEYEDNLHDVSYALTGRLDGIIETPDDGTRRSVAGEGDQQECEDDEEMFPDVLYSPAGMPLDTVMETQCDSSERSSVDHEEEYSVGEEQMPNYGVLDMSDEREKAGNEREEREEGRSPPTPSNTRRSSSSSSNALSTSSTEERAERRSLPTLSLNMSDERKVAGDERGEREEGRSSPISSNTCWSPSSLSDGRSTSSTEERAERRSSPTPSKRRSVSSRSSGKRKEHKPDSIFDLAQKTILQAQEILQTLSLESSSSSSC